MDIIKEKTDGQNIDIVAMNGPWLYFSQPYRMPKKLDEKYAQSDILGTSV